MPETEAQERIVIVLEPETPEETKLRTEREQSRLERLFAPVLREHQRIQRLIDSARPAHLRFIEDHLRHARGLTHTHALLQAAQSERRDRVILDAARSDLDRLKQVRNAIDPLERMRPWLRYPWLVLPESWAAARSHAESLFENVRNQVYGTREILNGTWTLLGREIEQRTRSGVWDIARFRDEERHLLRAVAGSSGWGQFDILHTSELTRRLHQLESVRLPAEWMEAWWARQDAETIRDREATPDEKNEAWIGLVDFVQNRLQMPLGYVPRFVYAEALPEDLENQFSPTEALMSELGRRGWQSARCPISWLRTALFREAHRFYKDQLKVRRISRADSADDDTLEDLSAPAALGESDFVTRIDWERACSGLKPDQRAVLGALFDGVRRTDLALYLEWDAAKAERVLKSLSAERRAGRELQRRLRAYRN